MRAESTSVILRAATSARRSDEARDLLRAPDHRQAKTLLRVGQFVAAPRLVQHREVEEAQRPDHLVNRVAGQFAIGDQLCAVLPNLRGCEPLGRALEIARQIVECAQVGARGTFTVVAARDFLARHFFVMGHRDLLVTQTYASSIPNTQRTAHAKRLP
jgi:hypothetical protein